MKLIFQSVSKSFGENDVLDEVSLEIQEGEVMTFIGASGSGKTTLLRCVNLLETIDSGRILLDGEAITDVGTDPNPIRRRVGMVFQNFNLFPHMSVSRNVTLALTEVLGKKSDEAIEVAHALLARFGLSEKIDRFPDQLSGGQQQRVAIARAMALNPEVLLLDEVTSALDPELVGEVLDVVRELKGSGITMLFATHEMSFAREISDRVCFLETGRLVEVGTPDQIFSAPVNVRTQQFLSRVLKG
jgi:polar amino acid transport system ATP-binding protein